MLNRQRCRPRWIDAGSLRARKRHHATHNIHDSSRMLLVSARTFFMNPTILLIRDILSLSTFRAEGCVDSYPGLQHEKSIALELHRKSQSVVYNI